jgi:glycosyltransferase involved in cell wall biosynthesis
VVSVIITTYNRKAFLDEAVRSVLDQSYEDKEIIVVDDGSTDGSQEAVRDVPSIRYEWKENGGISSARNLGIALAQGDYVAFLDVDDLWKREKLAVQMSRMAVEGSVISYTDEIWLKDGRWLNQRKRHRKYSGCIYDRCLPLCIISPSSALIRKEIFSEVGLFDETLPVCEDYDMWLRISCRYPILFIPEPLIVKRGGHDDQLSRSYEVMDKYRIKGLLKILDACILTNAQITATAAELRKKSLIVAKGAEKRGRNEEALYYYSLAERGDPLKGQEMGPIRAPIEVDPQRERHS